MTESEKEVGGKFKKKKNEKGKKKKKKKKREEGIREKKRENDRKCVNVCVCVWSIEIKEGKYKKEKVKD